MTVREICTCRIEFSYQLPASWSLAPNGSGSLCTTLERNRPASPAAAG